MDAAAIAKAVLSAIDGGSQMAPFTAGDAGFTEAQAYAVTAERAR